MPNSGGRGGRLGKNWEARAQQLASPRDQLSQLRYVPRALRLVWAAAPGWTAASLLLVVALGVLPLFTVYLTRAVVNSLVAVVSNTAAGSAAGSTAADLMPVIATVALMGLVLLANEVLGSLYDYVQTALAEHVQDHMNRLIHRQAVTLDLSFYESPTYYDQLRRASVDALDRPLGLLESLGSLLQSTITLVAMAGVLLTFAWWLPLVLLLSTLPALWVALRTTWQFHQWRLQNTTNQRKLNYYSNVLTAGGFAPELRLFGLADRFMGAYQGLRSRLRVERLDLARRQLLARAGASIFALLALALTLLWTAGQALGGRFNLGDLAMLYQAMSQGQRLLRSVLNGVGEIYRNLVFLEDLFAFLDLQPQLAESPADAVPLDGLHEGISLQNVTFRYPGSDRMALANFDLDIPAGQIVAIVGENGAGKSTLLKLLCRFYDPEGGAIVWDGRPLSAYAQADLRRRITVLFQQPAPYHETAADNIAFGDHAGGVTRAEVEAAAAAAAAEKIIARLPEGYDTILGRWFGQTELSVGEWQRVALARAFVRQADLIILDEPTSAMDSWAEAAWMDRFRALVTGRTALIITHRFTTAMQADIIHVMHEGRVVESGTHAELLVAGGRYATSWRQQLRETAITPSSTPA